MMTITPTSPSTPTMKVKRPREGGFCVTFSFWVLFCGGSYFSFMLVSSPKKIIIKNSYYLQIKHNKWFLPQSQWLCHSLGFL
jgi:hypothetical protein